MDGALLSQYRDHVAKLTASTRRVAESQGFGGLIIHSGSLVRRSSFDDQYWPLRPVPYFEHFAHLPWPECALVILPFGPVQLHTMRDRSFWERPSEPNWEVLGSVFALSEPKGWANLTDTVAGHRRIALVGENPARAAELSIPDDCYNPPALLEALDEQRVFKSSYEIAALTEANRIAALGHAAVAAAFRAGERSELRLHLLFLEATRQDDHETPYKNIVAIGAEAAILHHVHYGRGPKAQGGSLLLDAGATCFGYSSDITRTYAAVGSGSSAAAATFSGLVSSLDHLQQSLCDSVRVGRPYEDLHDQAHQLLGRVLVDLKIVRSSPEAAVQSGATRKFLPHGLGHSLGLVCHDVGCAKIKPRPDNPFLRNTRTIEAGQVFTIEPGIYFIDTLMDELRASPAGKDVDWALVDALVPFGGARIEDDVVVEDPNGARSVRNLTRAVLPG